MLLQIAQWEEIRHRFSEEEKATLNAAIAGETICPKGCILDEVKLGDELTSKLKLTMKKERLK